MSRNGGRGCCGGGIRAGVTDCGVIGRKLEAFMESDWRLEGGAGEGIATGGGWREGGIGCSLPIEPSDICVRTPMGVVTVITSWRGSEDISMR